MYSKDNPTDRMRERCYRLGKEMPNKIPHDEVLKLLAKIIVQEKVLDDDAFEIASKAYAKGFQHLKLGETNETHTY